MATKSKTLDEWMQIYEKKTGDKVLRGDPSRHLFYLPERGFCVLSIEREKSRLRIWEMCGDGKFWHDFAIMEADGQALDVLCADTLRPVKAYMRRFGGRDFHIGILNILYCRDSDGRLMTATPKYDGNYFLEKHLHNNNNNECEV